MFSADLCRCRSSIACLLSICCLGRGRTATRRNKLRNALLTSSGRDDRISFCSSGRGMILYLERMRSNTHSPITHHTFRIRTRKYGLRLLLVQDTGQEPRRTIETVKNKHRTSTGSSFAAFFCTEQSRKRTPVVMQADTNSNALTRMLLADSVSTCYEEIQPHSGSASSLHE